MTALFRGAAQADFNFNELFVDNFAGGGGASTGIESAIGRPVDIAINHDIDAIRMHEVNHPHTRHYCESVWDIDPHKVTEGRPVGLAWFSPDCKHFSKARGAVPVSKNIRGLAWVALRWAATVRPRIIMLENVEEFKTWGPVRIDEDGTAYPCPKRKGQTFNAFKNALEKRGYRVEHRELRACDYGAPTSRKRFFLIARCDGLPIVWPTPTHGAGLLPYRTAADIIDWSLPCPSIFERKKPLAEATLRRIAEGLRRYVIDCSEPFIVSYYGAKSGEKFRGQSIGEPLKTQTTENRFAVVVPTLIQTGYGEREGQNPRVPGLSKPLGTIVASGKHALVSAFLAKHYTGVVGVDIRQPTPTITTIDHNALVTSSLVKFRGDNIGSRVTDPLPTISAQGTHHAEVRAFLVKYYGNERGGISVREPLDTIPTHDRFGLVMVHGEPYQIVDIGMRMLTPAELFRAQGFPDDYIISHDGHGKPITKTAQVARCGNSVCPPLAETLVRANMTKIQQVAA